MTRSEQINELVSALAKAQLSFKQIFKETNNPAFVGSKYAELSAVISATRPALNENGLVIVQWVRCDAETSTTEIETMLAHSSGQFLSDVLRLPATMRDRFDAQSVGSSITYGRRYGLQAMINVAAEVDDDGNAASDRGSADAAKGVATAKLKSMAGTDQSITLTDWKGGAALYGNGVAILKSACTDEEKVFVGIAYNSVDKVFHMPAENVGILEKLCAKHQIPVVSKLSTLPKAVIPALREPGDEKPTMDEFIDDVSSGDPVILTAYVKPGKKGEFLKVEWDSKNLSCFQKELWSYIMENVGKPAMFLVKASGAYENITGILRLNGHDFSEDQSR